MKQFFLSQEAESSMAADLMASRGYGEGLRSTTRVRKRKCGIA
jgi:hypothetical protein